MIDLPDQGPVSEAEANAFFLQAAASIAADAVNTARRLRVIAGMDERAGFESGVTPELLAAIERVPASMTEAVSRTQRAAEDDPGQ
jgi:hypothetical protein